MFSASQIKAGDSKNSLFAFAKQEILRLTMVSTAAGVVLFGQSLTLGSFGAGTLFSFNEPGLGGSEPIVEQGLTETVNYYIGLASKKGYVGSENITIPSSIETSNQDSQNGSEALVIVNNSAIFGSAGFFDEPGIGGDSGNISQQSVDRKAIITYQVQQGDTPSSIADYFNISTNTLLWANNLTLADATRIKVGNKLTILPVSGVRHTVKKNETVSALVKKYKADAGKITAFNGLEEGEGLTISMVLIIPDGIMPAPPAPVKPKASSTLKSSSRNNVDLVNLNEVNVLAGDDKSPAQGRRFPWGQCTYYVAIRRYVPWNGNAKSWLANSRAYGFQTGSEPAVGAIVVTAENPRYGHVAYVEAVSDGKITLSEMNYVGLGIKSVRVLSTSSPVIRGYIYNK